MVINAIIVPLSVMLLVDSIYNKVETPSHIPQFRFSPFKVLLLMMRSIISVLNIHQFSVHAQCLSKET
jgi:hypothetical protein